MRAIFILPMLFLPKLLFGQEWAHVGAEWYYDITYAFSENIDYHRIYCDANLNFKGKDCKKIIIDYCACNNHYCEEIYTYESNDTIYFYNSDMDTFQILYNFGAIPGDSWEIYTKETEEDIDTVIVQVDDVETVDINGQTLIKQSVTYNYKNEINTWQEESDVIQKLGDLNFLINITNVSTFVCDIDLIHSLRCYYDDEIGLYSTGIRETCDYEFIWTSTDNTNSDMQIQLFPNPTNDFLTFTIDGIDDIRYDIYNLDGEIVKSGKSNNIVDLTNINCGVYFVKIYLDNRIVVKKIIKHLP